MSDEWTRERLVKELRHVWPETPTNDPDFGDALAVLASLVCGPNEEAIADFTGVPLPRVRELGERLRLAGLWVGDEVLSAPWFDQDGIAFTLDVLVAQGHAEREAGKYRMTEEGARHIERRLRRPDEPPHPEAP